MGKNPKVMKKIIFSTNIYTQSIHRLHVYLTILICTILDVSICISIFHMQMKVGKIMSNSRKTKKYVTLCPVLPRRKEIYNIHITFMVKALD